MDDIEVEVDHTPAVNPSHMTYHASPAIGAMTLPIHGGPPSTRRGLRRPYDKNQPWAGRRHAGIGKILIDRSGRAHTLRPFKMKTIQRLQDEKHPMSTDLTLTQYKLSHIYLKGRRIEHRLPAPRRFDAPGMSISHLRISEMATRQPFAQTTIPTESLKTALESPTAGLVLPDRGPFNADTLTELGRAICVAPGLIRTGSSETLDQNQISSVVKDYVRTTLTSLLSYYKKHPTHEDPPETSNTDWSIAVEHLDNILGQKWLKAQPVQFLQEKLVYILRAHGHELDEEASASLLFVIGPARNWPADLHPKIYAYLDLYRQVMGVVAISPSALMTTIAYFVTARTRYHAKSNEEPYMSMQGLEWPKEKPDPPSTSYPVPTDTYRDVSDDGLADDSSDDEMMDDLPPNHELIDNTLSSDSDSDHDPSQMEINPVQDGDAAFLNALDRWILHKKEKEQENDVDRALELEGMASLELTDRAS